jgi:LysR family transcriptional regulator, transcriptional activator of nhaA
MSLAFNYRHLYYFWVVAKEGGMARAAERLGMAVQTVSAQVHELERALGHALFKPAGRGLVLTDAGTAALAQADQIFALGELLPDKVREAGQAPQMRLAMGISDGLPKLVVHHLMQPVLDEPRLRLLCHEDEFDRLLAELALHKLDAVLADRPAPPHPNLKLYSHVLGSSAMAWYASAGLARNAAQDFPHCLAHLPVLLPTGHAVVRARLDAWFEHLGLRPHVVGEFEDSALLKTFGAAGLGVFPAPEVVQSDLLNRYRVRRIGAAEGVAEQFFVIGTEKKVQHPLVQRLLPRR